MKNKAENAFHWIIDLLESLDISYQISGGLAANVYGSKRELADIDIGVPDEALEQLLPYLKEFVTRGPDRYQDEQWDLEIMTLNYKGQYIDLSGEDSAKICNSENGEWVTDPSDIAEAETHIVFGREVPVVNKQSLLAYKKMLSREVDLLDIKSIN